MNPQTVCFALCIGGVILLIYAFFIEPLWISVSRTDVRIPGLPKQLDGFTICHLSDIHSRGYGVLEARIRGKLAHIDADLCVITGDLAQNYRALDSFGRMIGGFAPRCGIIAVLGNGERKWKLDASIIAESLAAIGIHLIVNGNVSVLTNGCRVSIIGVDDPFMAYDDISQSYDGCATADLDLFLAHSPDILANIGSRKPGLILSGHTHGGQVRLPFIGALWLHCRYPYRISSGLYESGDLSSRTGMDMAGLRMYVSRGLGASLIHARFLCRPEIALITLRVK